MKYQDNPNFRVFVHLVDPGIDRLPFIVEVVGRIVAIHLYKLTMCISLIITSFKIVSIKDN